MKNKHLYQINIIIGACILYAVSAGLRSVYGIMLGAISDETGITYATVSFAIAIGQLIFGVVQPVFGIIAVKKSNTFVLVLGSILIAVGLVAIPFCVFNWMLILFLGVLLPTGTGAVSFGIIMSTITPILGNNKAATASGFINASSGVGSIILSPIIQNALAMVGLKIVMISIALIATLLIPISIAISKASDNEQYNYKDCECEILPLMQKALCNKSYHFLLIGFFTCGFHMAIIETHLYSQIVSLGITKSIAAMSFSTYGVASVIGSLISGFVCIKFQMKWVISILYGSRMISILLFLLFPKTIPTIIVFTIVLGLTGAATVIPTSGIVGKLFGAKNIATLFGVVFIAHQIGSFLSAFLGGICVEAYSTYTPLWCVSAVLSVFAMLVSCCINEPEKEKSEEHQLCIAEK